MTMLKQDILFYVFLVIFVVTAALTLLGITNRIRIRDKFLWPLFTSLLLELVGVVIVSYRTWLIVDVKRIEPTVVTNSVPDPKQPDRTWRASCPERSRLITGFCQIDRGEGMLQNSGAESDVTWTCTWSTRVQAARAVAYCAR